MNKDKLTLLRIKKEITYYEKHGDYEDADLIDNIKFILKGGQMVGR